VLSAAKDMKMSASETAIIKAAFDDVNVKSSGADDRWYVRAYNVDDTAYIYVNGKKAVQQGFLSDSGAVDITPLLNGDAANSTVQLKTWNADSGYSWGYEISMRPAGGSSRWTLYNTRAGTAGGTGANGNDQTKPNQWVYDSTVPLRSLVPSAAP
jgi:hypothetical protein